MLKAPTLKAQDVLVVCKLWSLGGKSWTYAGLAEALLLSVGEVHHAVARCRQAQLVFSVRGDDVVSKRHFFDLLVTAVPRVFFAVRGGFDLGCPTSHSAPSLVERFASVRGDASSVPTIWPDPRGTVRGESLLPIYPSVPEAARKDDKLYELLALIDTVRLGEHKTKKRAVEILERQILS